jgi:hypothetical protein
MVSNSDSCALGVRAFPADQEPGAVGPAGRLEQAGDLADLGVFTQVTVGVDGGDPAGRGLDRLPDGFGDGGADTESDVEVAFAQGPEVGEEAVTGSGRVTAEQDRGAVPVGVGDLGEGLVEDGDVVGGGVRAGPAFTQQPGEGFAGVVQEAQQDESAWGAVPVLPLVRFPRPLAEPAVRLSTQRALHGCCRQAVLVRGGCQGFGIVPRYR